VNHRVKEIDDESDDHCQQHVQAHVLFLACRLPAHDVESGLITPSENNTNPANRPKNPTKKRSMIAIENTLRLFVCTLTLMEEYRVVSDPDLAQRRIP
jgi:hypothetical protein